MKIENNEFDINSYDTSDSKIDMYDENMISLSFNQALVKYEGGQNLHSPYFEEWDEKIDLIHDVFSRWSKQLETITFTGAQYSKALYEMHKTFMEDLIAFDFSTEIVNDLYSFADMLKELSSMHEALFESIKSSMIEYIKEFNEKIVMKVKDNKKVYNKYFDDYFNIVSKQLNQRSKSGSIEAIRKRIADSKKDLELLRMSYLDSLNEVIIHTKVDLIDKVCVCIYSFGSYFRQGFSMLEKLEPQLHSSTRKVAARSNILKHLKVQLENEKEKCRKDSENTENPNLRLKEKEGFVFKQNSIKDWLLRYLIIRDEWLFMVKRAKKSYRYNFNDARLFWNIFLAKIRKSAEYPDLPVFEIVSVKDNKTFVLFVENNKEMEEWISVLNLKVQRLIENPKPHDIKIQKYNSQDVKNFTSKPSLFDNDTEVIGIEGKDRHEEDQDTKILEETKQLINENICADCKTPFPEWYSSNLGVMLCITWSGYHRGLTTDISRIKSLTLDEQSLNMIKYLKSVISNDINNKVFEAKTSNADKDRRKNTKDFVKNKYEKKKYCKDLPNSGKKNDDLLQIWAKALEENNIIKLFPIIWFGMANLNQCFEFITKEGAKFKGTLLHFAWKLNNKDAILLLIHNNADSTIKDSNGMTPEELALIENNIDILNLLQNI